MKVLLLAASYPPVLGGLQTVVHQVAQHMHKRGHIVRVLTMRYPRHLANREVLDGVPVERLLFLHPNVPDLQRGRLDLVIAACVHYPWNLHRMDTVMQTLQPQVVNFHFPTHLTPYVLWLRKRYPFRLVVSLHGHDVMGDTKRTFYEQQQLRQLLRQADAITACAGALRRAALDLEPSIEERIDIHYNSVDMGRFADRAAFSHPRPYILFIGRLSPTKGVDLLLEAFAKTATQHPDVDLLIAGDGEARDLLETMTAACGLESRVIFLGPASPTQVVHLLNGCLFAVCPSRAEQFGIVAVEAMAAGKAVLATQVGGLPEVLPVPPNRLVLPTAEALATALSDWLRHRDDVQLHGQQNRFYAKRFDQSVIMREFETTLIGTLI